MSAVAPTSMTSTVAPASMTAMMTAAIMTGTVMRVPAAAVAEGERHLRRAARHGDASAAIANRILECRLVQQPGFGKRLAVRRRTFGQMRIVMNESAHDALTIARVFGGVQNVLMPEIIQVLRPGNDRLARVRRDEKEKLAIFVLHTTRALRNRQKTPLRARNFARTELKSIAATFSHRSSMASLR